MSEENLIIEPLQKIRVGETYSRIDRYRDFSRVFGSPEGKRVLSQIIHACEGVIPSLDDSHAVMAAFVSRVHLAAWLKKALIPPPQDEEQL